jgi:DNA polymerase-3 subunit epsilon
MYLLGIDTETTGLAVGKEDVIEIGAVLYDVKARQPVKILSEIIKTDKTITEFITNLTGITNDHIKEFGIDKSEIYPRLTEMAEKAVACVAHNAPFDRDHLAANGWETNKPWIDTVNDIPYESKMKYRELTYLAAHKGFINPFPHRAVTDVLTMFKVIEGYDLGKVVEDLKIPVKTIKALVSFADKDLAKAEGFKWIDKQWVKTGRFTEEYIKGLNFKVKEV